jgi:hypothetical protein
VATSAATFTTPITISETDTTYDGQDIVIDGPITVTLYGSHLSRSPLLTNGVVLTHLRIDILLEPCDRPSTYELARPHHP